MKSNQKKQDEFSRREKELLKDFKELLKEKTSLMPEPFNDYIFQGSGGNFSLSGLFADKKELMVYHCCGVECRACKCRISAVDATLDCLSDVSRLLAISNDPSQSQQVVREHHKWKLQLYSAGGNSFTADAGFLKHGQPEAGISFFMKDDYGRLFRRATVSSNLLDLMLPQVYSALLIPGAKELDLNVCTSRTI